MVDAGTANTQDIHSDSHPTIKIQVKSLKLDNYWAES